MAAGQPLRLGNFVRRLALRGNPLDDDPVRGFGLRSGLGLNVRHCCKQAGQQRCGQDSGGLHTGQSTFWQAGRRCSGGREVQGFPDYGKPGPVVLPVDSPYLQAL